jgi:hypothetical protein
MKKIIYLSVAALVISMAGGCVMVKHDNGKHKGWTKNTNNPHHPATTNPGKKKK